MIYYDMSENNINVSFPVELRAELSAFFKTLKATGHDAFKIRENNNMAQMSQLERQINRVKEDLEVLEEKARNTAKLNDTLANKSKELEAAAAKLKAKDHEEALAFNEFLNNIKQIINLSAVKQAHKRMCTHKTNEFNAGQSIIDEQLARLNQAGLTSKGLRMLSDAKFNRADRGGRDDPNYVLMDDILNIKVLDK